MAEGMASTDHFVTRCKATGKVCKVCGDDDPFHVHNGDERIEEYFTIGRGMTDIAAAREWQRRAVERGRALEVERRRTAALAREMTMMARDRDQTVALYEAAMNWFPDDEWERFEQSDEWRTANALASLDAGEPEPADKTLAELRDSPTTLTCQSCGAEAKGNAQWPCGACGWAPGDPAPASVEGEPDRMGLSGNLRIKSDSLVAEGFSGGGDGRPDRRALSRLRERLGNCIHDSDLEDIALAQAQADLGVLDELIGAVPVDREARIERVSAALRALPTYGFGLADVGIPGCAAAAVDALSGVVSSAEADAALRAVGPKGPALGDPELGRWGSEPPELTHGGFEEEGEAVEVLEDVKAAVAAWASASRAPSGLPAEPSAITEADRETLGRVAAWCHEVAVEGDTEIDGASPEQWKADAATLRRLAAVSEVTEEKPATADEVRGILKGCGDPPVELSGDDKRALVTAIEFATDSGSDGLGDAYDRLLTLRERFEAEVSNGTEDTDGGQ